MLLIGGAALRAPAAWDDRSLGDPALEIFGPRVLGQQAELWGMAQHPRSGAIYVAATEGLIVFDGQSWNLRPLDSHSYVRCVAFQPGTERVWVGAPSLGYFDELPGGKFRFVSLRDKQPVAPDELQAIWACHAAERYVDFVSNQHVLRWDGEKFLTWHYSGAQRLFPIHFEGALWFHHPETGLYRLDASGPVKLYEPDQLPAAALFWLGRCDGELVGASNRGLQTIGPASRALSSPALNRFAAEGHLVSVADLPGGFQAWATLHGGVAIVSPAGVIVRQINSESGLGGTVFTELVDREGNLWILTESNLARVPASGATATVKLPNAAGGLTSLRRDADQNVWLCADNRAFRVQARATVGGPLRVEALPPGLGGYRSAFPTPFGLLLARFGAIDLLHDGQFTANVASFPGHLASVEQAAPVGDDRFVLLKDDGFGELERAPDGTWRTAAQLVTTTAASGVVEDRAGNIWMGNFRSPLLVARRENGALQPARTVYGNFPAFATGTLVFDRADDILVIAQRRLFLLTSERPPRELALTLPATPIGGAVSKDGQRLYLRFQRADAPIGYNFGVGVVELSADGSTARWRDLFVPGLQTVGQLTALEVTRERDADTLWIGGSDGLIQARPAELHDWAPPHPPSIDFVGSLTGTEFSSDQQLHFQIRSYEIALRPALRFQTRFGLAQAEWSSPSSRVSFDFSSLREGTYTFSARTVNPAGQASEPTSFTFTILPPWYRSPWAYTGYAAGAGLAVLGAVRYRERRMLARTLELERLVHERTAELEKANAAKDEFLASMSHEIRNPMNGVVGLSAAIDISPLNDEGRYRFGLLRHCASHLASLLEDILDFSKLQSGTIELDPQPFSPAEVLEAVSAITAPVSAAAGVSVEFALGPTVPPRLIGDARRIRQVLLNYVGNAVKYAPQGTVEVTAWSRRGAAGGTILVFAVSDEGPGIPPEEQTRIFEKFERGAGARSSRIPGTGMGLAVCRRLAEKMGGRAWVESAPGQGSTFYLELELPIAVRAPVDAVERSLTALPKRALVVDDEEYNVVSLSALLERRGFTVRSALNGDEALRAAVEHQPDIIFLDYDMPDTTGPQLVRRIRETLQPLGRQPLVLATTAYSTVEKREECLAAGMDGFLGKPVVEERLRAALEQAILHRAPASARHLITPDAQIFDPLENLQMLARQHARTLESELAEFGTAAADEFTGLTEAIAANDVTASARAAHKISGRFGFLHAAAPMRRALHLEQICRAGDWAAAQRLAEELAHDWTALRDSLARLTCASAE